MGHGTVNMSHVRHNKHVTFYNKHVTHMWGQNEDNSVRSGLIVD